MGCYFRHGLLGVFSTVTFWRPPHGLLNCHLSLRDGANPPAQLPAKMALLILSVFVADPDGKLLRGLEQQNVALTKVASQSDGHIF